ncbi:MAG: hypothetical protein ABWJ97_01295 [Thermoproteus sp.]
MDIEEAVALLEAKLNSPTFVKAVGRPAAEAIRELIKAYKCNVVLAPDEVLRILNNYYIFESRLRRLIEFYEELSGGALTALARLTVGDELPDVDYRLLLKELEEYRTDLFRLAEIIKRVERSCGYSSTSSKA